MVRYIYSCSTTERGVTLVSRRSKHPNLNPTANQPLVRLELHPETEIVSQRREFRLRLLSVRLARLRKQTAMAQEKRTTSLIRCLSLELRRVDIRMVALRSSTTTRVENTSSR